MHAARSSGPANESDALVAARHALRDRAELASSLTIERLSHVTEAAAQPLDQTRFGEPRRAILQALRACSALRRSPGRARLRGTLARTPAIFDRSLDVSARYRRNDQSDPQTVFARVQPTSCADYFLLGTLRTELMRARYVLSKSVS